MFMNPSILLFSMTLILGTLITISSSTWLGCWIGLEINLLSFIPLMSKNSKFASEASLKYFLVQALASAIFLMSILMISFYNNSGLINNNYNEMYIMMMMSSLLMKMGAAPFHFWFPVVMEGLSWFNNLILMTWQKLAPFLILSYIIYSSNFMLLVITFCILFGSIGGLNQTSLRKIMAYSSINHLGWMLSSMMLNSMIWVIYYTIYIFTSIIMISIFMNWNLSHTLQLYNTNLNKNLNMMLFCNLLSLGGLPPFLGFLPKWLTVQLLINSNYILMSLLMVCFTLLALFFYVRMAYPAFLLAQSELKWNFYIFNKMNFFILSLTFVNIFGLLFTPGVYIFM